MWLTDALFAQPEAVDPRPPFEHNRTVRPLLTRPVAAPSGLPVEIRVSQAAECLIGLRLACMPRVRCADLEVGCGWFDQVRTSAPSELMRELDTFHRFTQAATLWLLLLGLVMDGPSNVPEFILLLEEMPASELWNQMLGVHSGQSRPGLHQALLAAGAGNVGPLEQEVRHLDGWSRRWIPEVVRLFGADAEAAKDRLVTTTRLWYAHVFRSQWPELEPALERDAATKRRLARQLDVPNLVDRATNGLEFKAEVGVERLVLIPTYLERPWVAQIRQGRTLVISYPAQDELGGSNEARLARVVKYARVLADEKRVGALRRLAGSSLTLQELADELGVSKSTMHHHLAALRSVGLLRFRPDGKRYSLRHEALLDLSRLLAAAFEDRPTAAR